MRIAVAGTSAVAIPALEVLSKSSHQLARVFTTGDRAVGRGRNMVQSDVATWSESHGLELIKVDTANAMRDHLTDVDCVVVIAFGILLPQEILDIPRHGFINLHFSLLPQWRGAAPVQRAIENGDTDLGITVFALDAGMDTGPIYTSAKFARDINMRSGQALDFLAVDGAPLLLKVLTDIESGVRPTPQSEIGASRAFKLSKDEAIIDWNSSSQRIHQKVCAFYPNPVARTVFRSSQLKVTETSLTSDKDVEVAVTPGSLVVEKNHLYVGTADGLLELVTVVPEGKSEMKAADWARGVRAVDGELCG